MGPQTKAMFWQCVFTFILVGITSFYAVYTYKMSETMENQFNLSYQQFQQNNRPFLYVKDIALEATSSGLDKITLHILNKGSIPTKVYYARVLVNFSDGQIFEMLNTFDDITIFPEEIKYLVVYPSENVSRLIEQNGEVYLLTHIDYTSLWDLKKDNIYYYNETTKLIKSNSNYNLYVINVQAI